MGIFGKKKTDDATAPEAGEKKDSTAEGSTASKVADKKEKKSAKKKKEADKIPSIAAAHGVIIAPIVTEKSHGLLGQNKYTFRVEKKASKKQIKDVVEEMYKVTVESVNVVVVKPRRRTVKHNRGYQNLYKKAVVTVREGDHIAVFEGA